jgi:NAD(P)-dependent dehydrogenase (short-subunit alcohol dehydrogenase family)
VSRFAGKVVLVTGGNSGIGLATAKRFAAEGATVYVTGRREAELDQAVAEIGGNAVGVPGDVAVKADLDRLFERIRREQGRLDVVFANAGGGAFAALGEITEEQFDREFGANVKGLLFTVQGALPLLKEGGAVVLNASIVASRGMPAFSVYSATKAAVRSFAQGWSADLKGRGIRVNVVSPGPIHTPGLHGLIPEDGRTGMAGVVPLGRLGEADEIASAVLFLASDEASFVQGAELVVDGGYLQV